MPTPEESPATKTDISEAVKELRGYIDERSRDMREYIDERSRDMREYIDERSRDMREYIDERSRDMQTELLRGFAAHDAGLNVRMRKLEADQSNLDAATSPRLARLEEQMTEFRMRLIALESRP